MRVDRIKGRESCPECKGEGIYHISIGDKNVPVKCGCVKRFEMANTSGDKGNINEVKKNH